MKKIKKIDSKAAQSVFSFACPCTGTCSPCVACGCNGPILAQTSYNASKASVALLTQAGIQAVNYN